MRISPWRLSIATWFLYPKAGTARSMRGEPSSDGFAFENFTVQRASWIRVPWSAGAGGGDRASEKAGKTISNDGLSLSWPGYRPARRRMCPLYVAGLIGPGDRKSVQPMAARSGRVGYDQLHHFVAAGVWDSAPLEAALLKKADGLVGDKRGFLVTDDTALQGPDRIRGLRLSDLPGEA